MALTGVSQRAGCHPANQEIAGLTPVRAHAWAAGLAAHWGRRRGN